jgi:hypothetical protein
MFLEYLYAQVPKISIDLGLQTIYLPFVPRLLRIAVSHEKQTGLLTARSLVCHFWVDFLFPAWARRALNRTEETASGDAGG